MVTTMNVNMTDNLSENKTFHDNCTFSMIEPQLHFLSTVAKDMAVVIPPLILALGLPGNFITIVVLLTQLKPMTSTAIYLLMLAVSDTTLLVSGALMDWLETITVANLRETNDFICKTNYYFYVSSAQISSCFLMAITIERIISLAYPTKFKRIYTPKRATVSGLSVIAFILALNTHFLHGFAVTDTIQELYGTRCGPIEHLEDYSVYYIDVWPVKNFAILVAIPFIFLSFGNAYILTKLIRQGYFGNANLGETLMLKRRKHLRNLTILVVCLNSVFLICLTPIAIILMYENEMIDWADSVLCTALKERLYRQGVNALLYNSAICLSYLNPSLNFVLYLLNGRDFRKSVAALLTCNPTKTGHAF